MLIRNNNISKMLNIFISRDFMLFIFIGVINTFNGTVFSYIYSTFMSPDTAFVFGYITSLTIAYLLNTFITFKLKPALNRYIKFCISYIPNFIIQYITVLIFLNILGWHKLIVYALAAIIGIPVTFILMKFFAFKNKN